MSFYLDTSVLVPLHVEEARSQDLQRWLDGVGEPPLISDLAVVEFGSTVSRLVRMKRMTPAVAAETLDDFDRWRGLVATPVNVLPGDVRTASKLVREPWPRLSPPDAVHLATCLRLGATFVSDDEDLLEIADRLGVPRLQP